MGTSILQTVLSVLKMYQTLLYSTLFYKFTPLFCRHFALFLWCLYFGGFTVVILFLY